MLLVWYIVSLVFAAGCLNGTFAKNNASFNISECKAYYRMQGKPNAEKGITTYYFGQSCRDLLQRVQDENIYNLPDAPRDIAVRISCDNRSADIVWVPRVGDGTANMTGFLLEARRVNLQDFNSTLFCFGIFMDETIASILLNESLDVPEFMFSCFETAPNATLEASIWSISSRDRTLCQSLHNCLYMVDQYSVAKFDMTPIDEGIVGMTGTLLYKDLLTIKISDELTSSHRVTRNQAFLHRILVSVFITVDKWCYPDCNCSKPVWRLMVVSNESAQCPGLQLHLDDVIWCLASLRFFIVHNETGDVVMNTTLEHKMLESSKKLTLITGLLQKSGRYYAKLEISCKDQRHSTCPRITKYISDYVSVSCDIPQPPGTAPPYPELTTVQKGRSPSKDMTGIIVISFIVLSILVCIFVYAIFICIRVRGGKCRWHVRAELSDSVRCNNPLELVRMEMLSPVPFQIKEESDSEEVQLLTHTRRKVTLLCHQDHMDPLQRDALKLLLSLLVSLGITIHGYDNSELFSNWLTSADIASNDDVTDFIIVVASIDNGEYEHGGGWEPSQFGLFTNAVMAKLRTRYAEQITFYVHILSFDEMEAQLISDFSEKHKSYLKIGCRGQLEKNTFIYCLSKHSEDISSSVLHMNALFFLLARILKRSLEDFENYISCDAKLHLQNLKNFFETDLHVQESQF